MPQFFPPPFVLKFSVFNIVLIHTKSELIRGRPKIRQKW